MTSKPEKMIKDAAQPERSADHEALAAFLGRWKAEGTAYGAPEQSADDPKGNGAPWVSEHHGYWHTGEFFLVQDERARPGGKVFDTLSIMGVDPAKKAMFARSFENHGFSREYAVSRDGRVWALASDTERATIIFSDDDRTQTIVWEWKPADRWLPLCDRVAKRIDQREGR